MPTVEELRAAAREKAQRQLQQKQAVEARETRALADRERAKPREEPVPTGKVPEPDTTKTIDVEAATAPMRARREEGIDGQLARMARAADDLVRLTAGPLGNALAAGMTESTMQEEAAKTDAARERAQQSPLGVGGTTGLEVAGQVGQALALPGAMFSTPGKAMLSGGGLGVVDTIFGRMEKGQPLGTQEGVEDVVEGGAMGAAGGFAGAHIGKMFGNMVSKFAGQDPRLAAEADRLVKAKAKVADEAGKAMDQSGVVVSSGALNHTFRSLRNSIEREREFTPATAKHGWKAMNILGARAGRGEDISLRNLNEIRKQIRNSVRSASTGKLLESVNDNDMIIVNQITRELNRLINTLPQRSSTKGNVKEGVAAWNKMNKNFMESQKAETVADLIDNAERWARRGDKSIDQALQDEFFAFTKSKSGKDILEREFTSGQRQVIDKLALGDFSQKTMNVLDRFFGGGKITSTLFNMVRSGHAAMFEAEAARATARRAVNSAAGIPTGLMERLAAGTAGPGMATPAGPALGGALGAAGAMQAPQGQGQPQRVMQGTPAAPTAGGPSGVPRNLAKPFPAQSQSALPQFPKVPGVTRP